MVFEGLQREGASLRVDETLFSAWMNRKGEQTAEHVDEGLLVCRNKVVVSDPTIACFFNL